MRKISIFAVGLAVMGLCSCNGNSKEAERNAELEGEVSGLIATQDSLLMLVNDITEGMNQIKELERIIATPGALDNETPSRKEQIKNDIVAIQKALEERRLRLDELEKKLASASGENSTLKKTVASLKTQIADQQTEIAQLTNQLAEANIQIEALGKTVDEKNAEIAGLNQTVENETRERQIAQQDAQRASDELNSCYYCMGSSKELKNNGILESGFLRKTKIMQGDYNINYFTHADKRTLNSIPTHSKKAEVMTNMPKDSYTVTDVNGEKVIKINNPAKFWSLSNFLVVKID